LWNFEFFVFKKNLDDQTRYDLETQIIHLFLKFKGKLLNDLIPNLYVSNSRIFSWHFNLIIIIIYYICFLNSFFLSIYLLLKISKQKNIFFKIIHLFLLQIFFFFKLPIFEKTFYWFLLFFFIEIILKRIAFFKNFLEHLIKPLWWNTYRVQFYSYLIIKIFNPKKIYFSNSSTWSFIDI